MLSKWIACDFSEQTEDSIAHTPEGAAMAQVLYLASECEINVRDLTDGYKVTVYELIEDTATEQNREEWEEIEGMEIGEPFYERSGVSVVIRVGLTCWTVQ